MSTVKYVILDYAKERGLVVASGDKAEMTSRLFELKEAQNCLEDPNRYELMPFSVFAVAFGCLNDLQ